jgi:formylglycine-generating enzyme required for sulfatase activity
MRPSVRGLFDLHGNLFEWCHDWFAVYDVEMTTDPLAAKGDPVRVLRGGSWYDYASICRSADRSTYGPTVRATVNGVRLALSPSGVSPAAEKGK